MVLKTVYEGQVVYPVVLWGRELTSMSEEVEPGSGLHYSTTVHQS